LRISGVFEQRAAGGSAARGSAVFWSVEQDRTEGFRWFGGTAVAIVFDDAVGRGPISFQRKPALATRAGRAEAAAPPWTLMIASQTAKVI
jgi:hypothetical protein